MTTNEFIPSETEAAPVVPATAVAPPPRKKRRWWFWVLVSFGSLAALVVSGIVAVVVYYHSLVKRYTTTQPVRLAAVDASPVRLQVLKWQWETFVGAVMSGKTVAPFKFSADDLNAFIVANNRDMSNRVRFQIEGDRLAAIFTQPLSESGKRELQGRHLNGQATLDLKFDNGFLTLHVTRLEANGTPAPWWLMNRVKKENILGFLERSPEMLDLLQRIDTVEVRDGSVVFMPLAQN